MTNVLALSDLRGLENVLTTCCCCWLLAAAAGTLRVSRMMHGADALLAGRSLMFDFIALNIPLQPKQRSHTFRLPHPCH